MSGDRILKSGTFLDLQFCYGDQNSKKQLFMSFDIMSNLAAMIRSGNSEVLKSFYLNNNFGMLRPQVDS